jgi:uncharacterized membrane protein YhaH (DUF805 family)
MEFTNAIKYGFKNYANFKGVIDRRTWWWWYLFAVAVGFVTQILNSVISGATSFADMSSGGQSGSSALLSLLPLAIYLPTLALMVRRLRDVGTNPLFLLFSLIPGAVLFIGALVGGLAGVSMNSGPESIIGGFAGVLLGMIPGFLLALGYGIWLIVLLAKPTKSAAQGNKYAVA